MAVTSMKGDETGFDAVVKQYNGDMVRSRTQTTVIQKRILTCKPRDSKKGHEGGSCRGGQFEPDWHKNHVEWH